VPLPRDRGVRYRVIRGESTDEGIPKRGDSGNVACQRRAALDCLHARSLHWPPRHTFLRGRAGMTTAATAEQVGINEYIALVNRYLDKNMTDGLPVIPPSASAVEAMCAASGFLPDHVVGGYPIRQAPVTVKDIAVNALMAGCLPEYMPILVAAHEAMFTTTERGGDAFGTSHMTQTAATSLPALIINGPVRHRLGIKSGAAAFGPGARANATIGRALRLSVINLAYGIPTAAGRSCVGSTFRLSMVVGEDEERSPWPGLHTEFGFEAADSTVLTLKVSQPEQFILETDSPERLLDAILDRWTTLTHFADGLSVHPDEPPPEGPGGEGGGRQLILFGEEHRALLADWSREHIRAYLAGDDGGARRGRLVGEIRSAGYIGWTTRFSAEDPDTKFIKRRIRRPENIIVASVGGRGWSSMLVTGGGFIKKLPALPAFRPPVVSRRRSAMAEYVQLVERTMESPIGDGLPLMPPDAGSIEAAIDASGRDRDDALGCFEHIVDGQRIHTRTFTVGEVAATAQMAGCLPEYLAVLTTALEILLEPRFDMYRVLSQIDGSAPYVVLNGPIRTKLDVNGWRDTFGPWKRANASMGRALNLCLRNIGGLRLQVGLGTASQYTGTLFAENEEESAWAPLHTDYGFSASDSTVMVLDCGSPVYCSNHQTNLPERFLKTVSDALSTLDNFDPQPPHRGWVMTFGEDLRIHLRNAGWSRRQVQEYMAANVGRTAAELRSRGFGDRVPEGTPDDGFVRLLNGPEDVIAISAGGGGAITFDCRGRLLDIRKLPD
jgi:hypothetical protein